jgi:hypothetical protein
VHTLTATRNVRTYCCIFPKSQPVKWAVAKLRSRSSRSPPFGTSGDCSIMVHSQSHAASVCGGSRWLIGDHQTQSRDRCPSQLQRISPAWSRVCKRDAHVLVFECMTSPVRASDEIAPCFRALNSMVHEAGGFCEAGVVYLMLRPSLKGDGRLPLCFARTPLLATSTKL